MTQGVKMILGTSFQQLAAHSTEPNLTIQAIGPLPIGICLGVLGLTITLFLLKNKKYPAAIVVISLGLLTGVIWVRMKVLMGLKWGSISRNYFRLDFPRFPT